MKAIYCKSISTEIIHELYISPVQAVWRLMEYATHQEKPAVMMLPFHREDRHRLVLGADFDQAQLAAAIETQSSVFLEWMEYNNVNGEGRDLLYSYFPSYYIHTKVRGWRLRAKGQTIGRMPVAHPQGEHFYLRLLTVKRGARSYRDLSTVNGIECVCPSAACRALGLLADEGEWVEFIDQIKDTATGHSLRMTLASLITNPLVTSAQAIWDQFKDYFTDDCLHRLSPNRGIINPLPANWAEDQCRYDYGLWLLGDILRGHNRDWASAYMTGPVPTWVTRERESNQLVLDALNFDRVEEERQYNLALTTFSPGQRSAFN